MGEEKKRHKTTHAHLDKEMSSSMENPAPQASPDQSQAPEAVAISPEEFEALKSDLAEARSKAAEYFDGWQRERADFANYKRRLEREQSQLSQNITGSIARRYLVVLDDLERALKTRPNTGEGSAWAEGIELIARKLQGILEAEGIQRMAAENETFDPARHEAISHEDSPDHESGQIIEVVQPGYLIGDRVLRPALVRVAR